MMLAENKRTENGGALSRCPGSRFLFYSHDGVGLGHTRRHLAVARALIEMSPESSVLLATGSGIVSRLAPMQAIDILKLPGLRKVSNEEYASRRLRIAVSEIRALRSELLQAAVKAYRPTVVLVGCWRKASLLAAPVMLKELLETAGVLHTGLLPHD